MIAYKINSANTRITLPTGLPAGNFYIGAIADYQNTVTEINETNNSIATSFQVTAPDLVIPTINGPTNPAAPATSVPVTGTVTNQGTSASPTTQVGIYFSTDNNITTADIFLGYVSTAGLAVGASSVFTKAVKIPAGLSPGTYYLGAIADYKNVSAEINETNNTAAVPITVYIPTPDLTVTAVSASPAVVAQRGTLTLTGTVANVGTGKTGAASYAGFYLSIGVTDIFLKQISVTSALAAGASVNLSTTYRLPIGFAPGAYTIKLIADRTGVLSEINESNNSMAGNTVTVLP